ncbi:MAG: hypothetical protein ABEJ73_12755 [Haloplanus sp.]
MRLRTALVALTLVLTTAGCAGAPTATSRPVASPTATPLPAGDIHFPEGPKAPPERPSTLNASAVREYVGAYEYRYVYNSLWINEYTDVTLDCRVDTVTHQPWGYEAVVTCTGYSNTRPPENSTVTPGPHADWFTQTYRYRVSEDTTRRRDAENRDPVS